MRARLNRWLARRSARHAYHFTLKDWRGIDDIRVAAGIIESDLFRNIVRPEKLAYSQFRRIMILAPHPDDELIGAGGLLSLCRNVEIIIVFVTNGRMRDLGRDGKIAIPADRTAAVRREEAAAVCHALGARFEEVGVDNIAFRPSPEHVHRLTHLLETCRPEMVLMPWLLDGSPKHRACNHLFWLAQQKLSFDLGEIWGYQTNSGILANGYVDITDEIDRKTELLSLYHSQNVYLRRYDHLTRGLAAWNARVLPRKSIDDKARFAELFLALPAHEYSRLLKDLYRKRLEEVYVGQEDLATAMKSLQHVLRA
jgi:LmbE family N-acetylglucosaminyl deacetylase